MLGLKLNHVSKRGHSRKEIHKHANRPVNHLYYSLTEFLDSSVNREKNEPGEMVYIQSQHADYMIQFYLYAHHFAVFLVRSMPEPYITITPSDIHHKSWSKKM